jgi:acyl-CoA hydrolase
MAHHGKENNLKDITVIHMHTEGPAYYAQPEYSHIFRSKSTFMGGNVRKAVAEGRADSIPIFLHEIPLLFRRGLIPIDVALIQSAPIDQHGYGSLGTSVDCVSSEEYSEFPSIFTVFHVPGSFSLREREANRGASEQANAQNLR